MTLIRTPLHIDRLDNENVWFAGTAEESRTVTGLFGEAEIETKYPLVILQRAVWESLGSPVGVELRLEEIEHG